MNTNSMAFPLFVPLTNCKVIVVGGGKIASRRIRTLSQFGARIIVISPHVTQDIKNLIDTNDVEWVERAYQSGDCVGARIVVTATNCREVNKQVGQECEKLFIPVSVADSKEESTYYFPGIACEGSVVVGVTASGTNHSLAKHVTDEIKRLIKGGI